MNFSQSVRQIVGAVAPTLGTALGGPLGAVAGTFIAKALGAPPGDEKAIEAAVASGDPDVLVKLKQADNDFKAHLADVGLAEDRLVFDDKANARSREIALRDSTPAILAYGVTIGFFGTLGYLLAYGKPAAGGDALLVLLGSLGTAWTAIVSFYYGSSQGSARKDAALVEIAKQP